MAKNEQVNEQVKVKLSSARCGHRTDKDGRFTGAFADAAGDEITVPVDEAERLVEGGYASLVKN